MKDSDLNRPVAGDAMRPAKARDNELQADPELQEGPASASRIAIYGLAVVVVLGAVFYGLSNQTPGPTGMAQSPSPTTTADSKGASPPNIRDVTPNREPGTTTGTAPAMPQNAPQSNPTGSEVDQNKGSAAR